MSKKTPGQCLIVIRTLFSSHTVTRSYKSIISPPPPSPLTHQLRRGHAFYCAFGSYRHEYRGGYGPMRKMDCSCPCPLPYSVQVEAKCGRTRGKGPWRALWNNRRGLPSYIFQWKTSKHGTSLVLQSCNPSLRE